MQVHSIHQTNNLVQNYKKNMHKISFGHVKKANVFKILSCSIAAMSLFAVSSCVKEEDFIKPPKNEQPKGKGIDIKVDTVKRIYTYDWEV